MKYPLKQWELCINRKRAQLKTKYEQEKVFFSHLFVSVSEAAETRQSDTKKQLQRSSLQSHCFLLTFKERKSFPFFFMQLMSLNYEEVLKRNCSKTFSTMFGKDYSLWKENFIDITSTSLPPSTANAWTATLKCPLPRDLVFASAPSITKFSTK